MDNQLAKQDGAEKIATVMCHILQQDGPDGIGIYRIDDNWLIFKNRRISIIDLGANGYQPMADVTAKARITTGMICFNKVGKTFVDTV